MPANILRDLRILVVEDDYFIATSLAHDLAASGAAVVGPVPSVEQALAIVVAGPAIDAAALDINLNGDTAFPVADALTERGVPFVFVTGYDETALLDRYAAIPRCTKPLEFRVLLNVLKVMVPDRPG